jgi:hypothetical protein
MNWGTKTPSAGFAGHRGEVALDAGLGLPEVVDIRWQQTAFGWDRPDRSRPAPSGPGLDRGRSRAHQLPPADLGESRRTVDTLSQVGDPGREPTTFDLGFCLLSAGPTVLEIAFTCENDCRR